MQARITAMPRTAALRPAAAARVNAPRMVVVRAGGQQLSTATVVQAIDHDAFMLLTQTSEVPVLVDFYSNNCGPCKMIAPKLEVMAAEFEGRMVVAKMDCYASDENKKLAMGLKIRALPTFHVWHKGEKLGEMTGAQEAKLRELIETHSL